MLGKGVAGWSFGRTFFLVSSCGCVSPYSLLGAALWLEAQFLLKMETSETAVHCKAPVSFPLKSQESIWGLEGADPWGYYLLVAGVPPPPDHLEQKPLRECPLRVRLHPAQLCSFPP